MSNTHLIIPDPHAHPDFHNERASWLAKLIMDIQPNIVINLGDQAEMSSLSSFEQGKASFVGRTYQRDIEASLDFQERLWSPVRKRKKRLPRRVFLIGNHERRIWRALDSQPNLEGTISYNDLDLESCYDEIIDYDGGTPGLIVIDGIHYAHYFISGIMGRAISSDVSLAAALLTKNFTSSTCGHSHIFDHSVRTNAFGHKIMGLTAGCFIDYNVEWAGDVNRLWSRGVVIKRAVEDGSYNIQWISLGQLEEEYG